MVRSAALLCAAFLTVVAFSAEITVSEESSDLKGKQCLLQQQRQVSKSAAKEHVQAHGEVLHKSNSEEFRDSSLRKRAKKTLAAPGKKHGRKSKEAKKTTKDTDKKHDKKSKSQHKASFAQMSASQSQQPDLKELLPEHLLDLAYRTFKTEGAIRGAIENSVVVPVTHAGVAMSLRINKFDDATTRLGAEGTWFSYDLDTLGDTKESSQDVLNMIDIGGNYGVVTIAAMKKYAQNLRVVTVEPIPTTFFFLKWNLHLNGIPEIQQSQWDVNKGVPGVLALNEGSSDVPGQSLHFCSYPQSSMNSKMCDCREGEENCVIIPSITVDNLADMFGKQPISMVKMDCEGCEFKSLPALAQTHISTRVRRLAGELHIPDKTVEDLACRWDNGRLVTKCQFSPINQKDVECDVKLSCPN